MGETPLDGLPEVWTGIAGIVKKIRWSNANKREKKIKCEEHRWSKEAQLKRNQACSDTILKKHNAEREKNLREICRIFHYDQKIHKLVIYTKSFTEKQIWSNQLS